MEKDKVQTITAVILIVCVLLVAFWEIMSNRSTHGPDTFELNNKVFAGFKQSASPGFAIKSVPVVTTVLEPNIAAFAVKRKADNDSERFVLTRLVHGYNMCDCMRIKGYKVEMIADARTGGSSVPGINGIKYPVQIWRLTSSSGNISIWVTSMLRAGNFAVTSTDVRSMAFPRVGTVDSPDWMPQGFTLKSLRHPIKNTKMLLRAKWNNARCDIWTFLRLKRPAWASEEMLTLVSIYRGPPYPHDKEKEIIQYVVNAHGAVINELKIWNSKFGSARNGLSKQ